MPPFPNFGAADTCLLIVSMNAVSLSMNPIGTYNDKIDAVFFRISCILAFIAPTAIYCILYKYRIKNAIPNGFWFEWSHYGAVLSVIMIQIFYMVGLYWSWIPALLFCTFLSLLLSIFASNFCSYPSKKFKLKIDNPALTMLQIKIYIAYAITSLLIIIFFPMDGPTFIAKDSDEKCQNPWVCMKNMNFLARFALKSQMFVIVSMSNSVFLDTFRIWNAKKLTVDETPVIRKQALIRDGWSWVEEPVEHGAVEL